MVRRPAQLSVEENLRRADRVHKAAAGVGVAVVVTGVVVAVSTLGGPPPPTGSETMFAWSLEPATPGPATTGTTTAELPPGEPPGGGGLVGALVGAPPSHPTTTTRTPAPDPAPKPGGQAPKPGGPVPPEPPVVTPTAPPSTCSVRYAVQHSWPGGFTAAVVITNTAGAPLRSWTLGWTFAQGQRVTQGWNGTWSQYGSHVQVTAASWNAAVPAGGSVTTGFNGSFGGPNPAPGSFTVNGEACRVS